MAIDREAEIPDSVVRGLGQLGVLGACLPRSCGGLGLSQASYCRLLEVLGGHCGSTALFVNAHHSIGPRALVLFGTDEQQRRWLPKLASGEWISAFALTEPEAGSDAANVQTTATPTRRRQRLRPQRRKALDHQRRHRPGADRHGPHAGARRQAKARSPPSSSRPTCPAFEVVEKRMEKMGVRGTATSRLAFHDMFVPRENVLGQLGKGLKVALTVLDFGRTTFGASCTGAAKFCVERAVEHANRRVQFGQTLASFELVKEKLAYMQAGAFAMEACTYQTAALIDSGEGDFMLETAMLKVFATETLWRIINDTFQIHGGKAYFTDQPFERMMRDARINMIGEGANDVLRAFTALVGMRDVGLELQGHARCDLAIRSATWRGSAGSPAGSSARSSSRRRSRCAAPSWKAEAAELGKLVGKLGANVERLLRTYQMGIVDRQYQLGRVADAATELYVSACVLNRLDVLLRDHHDDEADLRGQLETGRYYLRPRAAEFAGPWPTCGTTTTTRRRALANRMLKG